MEPKAGHQISLPLSAVSSTRRELSTGHLRNLHCKIPRKDGFKIKPTFLLVSATTIERNYLNSFMFTKLLRCGNQFVRLKKATFPDEQTNIPAGGVFESVLLSV